LQGDTVTQAKGMPFETPAAPSRYARRKSPWGTAAKLPNLFLRGPLQLIDHINPANHAAPLRGSDQRERLN